MAESVRKRKRTISFSTPALRGDKGLSTPVKTGNIATSDSTISIYPVKRTSTLGIVLLVIVMIAFVPIIIFSLIQIPFHDLLFKTVLAWDGGALVIVLPILLYSLMQDGNRIVVSPLRSHIKYQNAFNSSVSFYYGDKTDANFSIVYFANSTAQTRFTKHGWAGFYRDNELMFRLDMERWDVDDLWWISENIPTKIMVIHQKTGFKYIEKKFHNYFPMFAVKPVLSGALIILGIAGGLLIEAILWSIAFRVL